MATIYRPRYQILVNGFDVSNTIAPYLVSINIEEVFNTSFSPTKLELIFHANYVRSSAWKYKDLIRVNLWWEPNPFFIYESPTFYVDYVDDVKDEDGNQTFRVAALAADPELGFNYGIEEIKYTDTTIEDAIDAFGTLFGLTVFENLTPDVFLGTINDINNVDDPPSFTTVFADFESYSDMLRYICQTYGYYGDLRGTTLRLFKVSSAFSDSPRFIVPRLDEIFNFVAKQTYNKLYKKYNLFYVESGDLLGGFLTPPMASQLNNKELNIDYNDAYFGVSSAIERVNAAYNLDLIEGFQVEIELSGLDNYSAGSMFLLDANYGIYEGFYRCTRCIHRVDGNGWRTSLNGFPINTIGNSLALFNTGYLGRKRPPNNGDLIIPSTISGTITGFDGSELDDFADSIFLNYNALGLGSIFVTEGNKAGNSIRADIAFCLFLVVTRNATFSPLMEIFNPGELFNSDLTAYAEFGNWTTGIRATIQHLYAYANVAGTPADTIVDPRFGSISRGSVTTVNGLDSVWNGNNDLGYMVMIKLQKLYEFLYPDKNIIIS